MYFVAHGVIEPEELSLLRSVLDEYGDGRSDVDRDLIAARLLSAFRAGARDRLSLSAALKVHD